MSVGCGFVDVRCLEVVRQAQDPRAPMALNLYCKEPIIGTRSLSFTLSFLQNVLYKAQRCKP